MQELRINHHIQAGSSKIIYVDVPSLKSLDLFEAFFCPKTSIKNHYVDLTKEELFEPSKNICAGIRWLFRKRENIQKKTKLSKNFEGIQFKSVV